MKRRRAASPPAKEREALFRKNKRHAYYRKHNEFFQENKRKSKATPRVSAYREPTFNKFSRSLRNVSTLSGKVLSSSSGANRSLLALQRCSSSNSGKSASSSVLRIVL
jgi:hypothetical protein